MEDDYEKKQEIFLNGIYPTAPEPQCLLGYPLDKKLTPEEIKATRELYNNIRYLQEDDITKGRLVLERLPKDKIIWY